MIIAMFRILFWVIIIFTGIRATAQTDSIPPLPKLEAYSNKEYYNYEELLANIYSQIRFDCCIYTDCTTKIGFSVSDNGEMIDIKIIEDNCLCQLGEQCLTIIQSISQKKRLLIDDQKEIIIPINFKNKP